MKGPTWDLGDNSHHETEANDNGRVILLNNSLQNGGITQGRLKMINESINNSESDLKKFVSSLVATKKSSIEQDKLNDVIEQLTNIVTETKKYTDWNVKSNTTAELKL